MNILNSAIILSLFRAGETKVTMSPEWELVPKSRETFKTLVAQGFGPPQFERGNTLHRFIEQLKSVKENDLGLNLCLKFCMKQVSVAIVLHTDNLKLFSFPDGAEASKLLRDLCKVFPLTEVLETWEDGSVELNPFNWHDIVDPTKFPSLTFVAQLFEV
jgi:hypothetical protein